MDQVYAASMLAERILSFRMVRKLFIEGLSTEDSDPIMLQLVVYALVALVIGSLLYSVLGRPVGHMPEEKKKKPLPLSPQKKSSDTARHFTGPAGVGLTSIAKADNSFDPENFMAGAQRAYERIVGAYLEGNKAVLEPLLTPEIYKIYSESIDKKESEGDVLKNIKIIKSDILSARLEDYLATIMVRFIAEITTSSSPENSEGKQDGVHVDRIEETWAFVHDVDSDNPNWKLDSVSSVEE